MSNIPNIRREELHAVGLLIFVQLNDSGAGDFRRLAHVLDMQFGVQNTNSGFIRVGLTVFEALLPARR